MGKKDLPDGWGSTADLANFAGTNKTRIGDYRDRKILEEKDYRRIGAAYYYHLENCAASINAKVKGRSGNVEPKDIRIQLEKENIPSKAISDARKAHYSAQKERISLEQLQGELIAVGDFKKALLKEAKELKESFEVLPERVAPQVAGMENINEISELLHQEINDILAGLFARFID